MNNDNSASLTSDVGRHHAAARCGKRDNPDQLQHTHFFFQEELKHFAPLLTHLAKDAVLSASRVGLSEARGVKKWAVWPGRGRPRGLSRSFVSFPSRALGCPALPEATASSNGSFRDAIPEGNGRGRSKRSRRGMDAPTPFGPRKPCSPSWRRA